MDHVAKTLRRMDAVVRTMNRSLVNWSSTWNRWLSAVRVYIPIALTGLVFIVLILVVVCMSRYNASRHVRLLARYSALERANESLRERVDTFRTYIDLLETTVARRNETIRRLQPSAS